jgi:hypothetical protein
MKIKILLFVMGLIMTAQIIYSQTPSYVPTNGLVGYWPFNGNANDQSVNGLNGINNGATLTTDRFGNTDSAYSFLNGNQYITLPSPQANTFVNAMSYSLWYKEIPNADFLNIFNASGKALVLSPNASGIRANDGNSFGVDAVTPLLNSNNWKHIFVIYEGQNISIYINGNLIISGTTGFSAIIQYLNPQSVVGSTYLMGGQYPYVGLVDDIAIWNRALSQQEITNIYNGVNYSDTCNAVSGSLVNGLVAYYPFCGNANDQSGNGYNGTVNGATLTTDRFGNINSAYNFDGVNDYISTNYSGILGTNSRTISFWYNSNSNNIEETVFTGYGENNCGVGFACTLFPLNKPAVDNTCSWIKSVNSTTINSWNFYTMTYASSDGSELTNCKIYINGVLQSTSQSSTLYNINTINGLNMVFGSSILFNPNQFFNGKLDDIGIWNRALTQQEIAQLFNQNQCITNITVTDTLIINVGQLSYTNPISFANNITIYPNPASTQVNISFNNITDLAGGSIKIINSLGQQVATTPITLSGTNTTLALNSWGGTGLYFVQILNAQGQILDIKKIILQ